MMRTQKGQVIEADSSSRGFDVRLVRAAWEGWADYGSRLGSDSSHPHTVPSHDEVDSVQADYFAYLVDQQRIIR